MLWEALVGGVAIAKIPFVGVGFAEVHEAVTAVGWRDNHAHNRRNTGEAAAPLAVGEVADIGQGGCGLGGSNATGVRRDKECAFVADFGVRRESNRRKAKRYSGITSGQTFAAIGVALELHGFG